MKKVKRQDRHVNLQLKETKGYIYRRGSQMNDRQPAGGKKKDHLPRTEDVFGSYNNEQVNDQCAYKLVYCRTTPTYCNIIYFHASIHVLLCHLKLPPTLTLL